MARYEYKPKFKVVRCTGCGRDLTVGWKTKLPQRCLLCGIQAGTDAMIQIKQKSGPYYDRWLAGMRNWFDSQGTATGAVSENVHRST